ncbi:MAG TPA: alpha/beta hydrolase-fold protein [Planctomycetota bacterium]|nr:alpha/beta hydrolase-fold protein [Planctomycetota bacterium]
MSCRLPHDVPTELAGLPARPEFHALAMPRAARGEIDNRLLECQRLPGLRLLRIYVPARELRGDAPLPVLLVNDGHKAFEPANHRAVPAWQQSGTLQLHRVMDGLLCTNAVRPAVVVAIATHASSRADQYVPVRAQFGGSEFGGFGDAYLDVLEHEVLPAVRAHLRGIELAEQPRHRALVGTSIGGVSALYGALVRPQVFGAAIALSPSAWIDDGFLTRSVRRNGAVHARIATDIGDDERAPIREHCRQLFAELAERGGERVLANSVAGMHNEDSWRERLPRLLQHVLGAPDAARE